MIPRPWTRNILAVPSDSSGTDAAVAEEFAVSVNVESVCVGVRGLCLRQHEIASSWHGGLLSAVLRQNLADYRPVRVLQLPRPVHTAHNAHLSYIVVKAYTLGLQLLFFALGTAFPTEPKN